MEINEQSSLDYSIKYAKKFGFISRSFFWNHFCKKSRASNFRYWSLILSSGAFIPYREIQGSEEYYYLNLKSSLVNQGGPEPVGKRSPLYLYHDEKIMSFIFTLESLGFIHSFWSEQELRSNPTLAFELLGGKVSKLPDLVFDLNCKGFPFRTALEIETTRKSNSKYYKNLLSYSSLKNLDLILYGADQKRIIDALRTELTKGYFNALYKKSGFFSIPEFEKINVKGLIEINSNQIEIGQFYKNLINIRENKFNFSQDKIETPVSSNLFGQVEKNEI